MDLAPLLRAHAFLQVERPPELWRIAADDRAVILLLGELIAATLVRGNELHEVALSVANVTVSEDPDHPDDPPIGDYVAMTLQGKGETGVAARWSPGGAQLLVSRDVDRAARAAAVPFAYTQNAAGKGSITVFLPAERRG